MSTRRSTKIHIPHPTELNICLVGVLEQLEPEEATQGRKVALILHGTLGHKDYLFQKKLATSLPFDSFRFDFRGNHESGGVWKQGNLSEDLVDLQAAVDYLKSTYGYVIELVIGHSRGSIISFRWLATTEDGRRVPAFVNASGRYRMQKIKESPNGRGWQKQFETKGYFSWNVTVAGKQISATVTPEDVEEFVNWDTSFVWDQFPPATDVLTLHGLADNIVSPYDALIYAKALGTRSPGTHTLHLMEDADHNFTGRQAEVVECILQWWDTRQKGQLSTGIMIPGMRGKL